MKAPKQEDDEDTARVCALCQEVELNEQEDQQEAMRLRYFAVKQANKMTRMRENWFRSYLFYHASLHLFKHPLS